MRLGIQIPNFTYTNGQAQLGDTFAQIAERAERAGFYSLWVMDHFFQIHMVGPAENEMLEGWSALAFAAARTNRIKLGTMVTGVTYRHPGLLVKTATTLDVLSHGRAYFGVGAAWNEQEHAGLGVPFPPLGERFERLEETLQIAHQMWKGDEKPFEGKHYQLTRPLNSPQSVQRPHPPILIGGTGERKTLRMVAQYGDGCNLFARLGKEGLQQKLDVLRGHCEALGRPYEEIEKTTLDSLKITRDGRNGSLSASAAIDLFGSLAEQGIDQAIFSLQNVEDIEAFDILATEIVPVVEKIAVAGR
ncbi:LLM class F420-dependent oxidoreductase [Tengunoibacter tsumagoiensis]|uniref:LLM class F420-dependent oxidoreductase n=1 Tax=Tengunoibacter tsumagoiensis TaxID=2014871 RepID=A0A401ZXK1_9CHLR|nr:LLM class F420-dependent oxidoreductase [Tengunoibacter tsumagoiensis]GCE11567.1 LLM class F420-dependent oxidoreductase [Tengunoibacter tsumagoiensis]